MESFVVSHNDPLPSFAFFDKIRCKPLCGAAQVFERVIICNHRAPAICAKFYCVGHESFSSEVMTCELYHPKKEPQEFVSEFLRLRSYGWRSHWRWLGRLGETREGLQGSSCLSG